MLELDAILAKIFGTTNEREIKRMRPLIAAINDLEPEMQKLSDAELAAKDGRSSGSSSPTALRSTIC